MYLIRNLLKIKMYKFNLSITKKKKIKRLKCRFAHNFLVSTLHFTLVWWASLREAPATNDKIFRGCLVREKYKNIFMFGSGFKTICLKILFFRKENHL